MKRELSITMLVATLAATAAQAAPCPGNPDALGTARVLTVDGVTTPRVGRKHFPQTLPLARKEVVLTFDDGPWPRTTPRVLDVLKRECVQATFFLLGRNAAAEPALARRELADGHTVAYHTYSHPLLNHMSPANAEAEIDRGFAAIDNVLYGRAGSTPVTPFFRFPGFASSPTLLDRLARRGIVTFGADLWASDWNPMSPDYQLRLVLARLERERWWYRAVSRHKSADRGDACALSARIESSRLPSCAQSTPPQGKVRRPRNDGIIAANVAEESQRRIKVTSGLRLMWR